MGARPGLPSGLNSPRGVSYNATLAERSILGSFELLSTLQIEQACETSRDALTGRLTIGLPDISSGKLAIDASSLDQAGGRSC